MVIVPDYGVDKYDIGTAFGHFGIAVEDVRSFVWNVYLQTKTFGIPYACATFYYKGLGNNLNEQAIVLQLLFQSH